MADAPAPRRRRWLRNGLVLLFFLGLIAYLAPWIVARTGLVQYALRQSLADFNGTATLDSATLGWFRPVELHNLRLADAENRPLLDVPHLITSKSLFALIMARGDFGTITLEAPRAAVVCQQGLTNWEASLTKLLEKPKYPAAPTPRLTLRVQNASLAITDADTQQKWQFDSVQSTIGVGPAVQVKLGVPAPHLLELDATLDQQLAASANVEGFPIEPLAMLLRRFEPGLHLSGRLSGQIATDTQDGSAAVAGSLAIRQFTATSPRLGPERIALETIDLPFKLTVAGPVIRVEHSRLTCPLGEAAVQGRVDLSQPLEQMLQQPGINASARLDLAELARAIPGALRLKPGTELHEGRAELHVSSRESERGIAWDGQLKTTSLRGRRDARELRWNEPIIASFLVRLDDRLHPEFDKLEAASDFATLSARGNLNDFNATAEVSLDALAAHLRDFIDLEGITLAGSAKLAAAGKPDGEATAMAGRLELANFNAAAADWHVAGQGDLAGNVRILPETIKCNDLTGTLEQVRFRGFGLNLDEPMVKVLPTSVVIERASGQVSIPRLQAATQTVSIGAEDFRFSRGGIDLRAAVNVDLHRLRSLLRIGGEPFGGVVRGGNINLQTTPDGQRFTARWPIEQFYFGPVRDPHWSEPSLTLVAEGLVDHKSGLLEFTHAVLERPDGVAVTAAGRVNDLAGTPQLDFTGQIRYDLVALQPQIQAMLGSGFRASGRDQRPFTLRGSTEKLEMLVADASVTWQQILAYGFEVGPASLNARMEQARLSGNTVEATFGGSGRVRMQPTLDLKSLVLTLERGRIVEKATVTPEATAAAIGYALPAIARSTQATGTISFDLHDHAIPLNNINEASMRGNLVLHDVTVVPGPVISGLLDLLENRQQQLTLARDQTVPIRVERGRVFHENLQLTIANTTLTTRGSVGFDGSLQLVVETPLPQSAIGPLLKNTPAIREAAMNKRITVTIGGTLERPALDRQAFQAAVAQFVREVTRDAAKGALGNLLQKALEPPPPKKP